MTSYWPIICQKKLISTIYAFINCRHENEFGIIAYMTFNLFEDKLTWYNVKLLKNTTSFLLVLFKPLLKNNKKYLPNQILKLILWGKNY